MPNLVRTVRDRLRGERGAGSQGAGSEGAGSQGPVGPGGRGSGGKGRRGRGGGRERGNAIIEFGFLTIMFLVPLTYIMLGVFELQKAMYASSAAARDASRAYTLAETPAAGVQAAQQSAELAFEDQGLTDFNATTQLELECIGVCLAPESAVMATVDYQVPLPFTGFLGGIVDPVVPVTSTHITPYGDYREGG